jgi:hypothetical protein
LNSIYNHYGIDLVCPEVLVRSPVAQIPGYIVQYVPVGRCVDVVAMVF